ncbi:MAG: hypothetical protein ACR2HQ_10970 [Ilumatobacteraceae bacterium]
MSERGSIVAVFRAVDEQVSPMDELSVEARGSVARILPAYEKGAAGWFARFLQIDPTFADGLPDTAEALTVLVVDLEDRALEGKRMLALSAVLRVEATKHTLGGDELEIVTAALFSRLREDLRDDDLNIERLRQLLLAQNLEEQPSELPEWERIVREINRLQLLTVALDPADGRCCQDDWLSVPVGGRPVNASVIITHFSTTEIGLGELRDYLNPANWPDCSSLWCSMQPIPTPVPPAACYLEVISTDCDANAWRLSTCLQFVMRDLPGGALSLEYNLCDHPQHQAGSDHRVTVDQGSITAYQDDEGLHVATTKRVCFRDEEFHAAQFAMWACALGYGEAAKEMAIGCAKRHPAHHRWDPRGPDGNPMFEQVEHFIDHAAHTAADGLKACAASSRTALDKVAAGTYTVGDLANDVTDMWARAAKDVLALWAPFIPTRPQESRPGRTVDSIELTDPGPRVAQRDVAVDAPLTSGFGRQIPVAAVQVVAPMLAPQHGTFYVEATIDQEQAGTYAGSATITDRPGHGAQIAMTTVPFWVQVG